MTIEITHVRYRGTAKSEHNISQVQWRDASSRASGEMGKHALIVWLESQQGEAFIGDGQLRVPVGVVGSAPKVLCAQAEGPAGLSLTHLPEF